MNDENSMQSHKKDKIWKPPKSPENGCKYCDQACVCGLVTMANCYFQLKRKCLLFTSCPSQQKPSATMAQQEHRLQYYKNCQQTNNSNSAQKLFTQDFSFIFHFVQITYRQLSIHISLFYFVICVSERCATVWVHVLLFFPILHIKLDDKVAKGPQFNKIFCKAMRVAGFHRIHQANSETAILIYMS